MFTRRNRTPQVKTVTEDNPDDTTTNADSTNNNTSIERTTTQPTLVEEVYDPMVDPCDPAIITPSYSYIPLNKKMGNGEIYVNQQLYMRDHNSSNSMVTMSNINSISDSTDLKYDEMF